MIFAESGFSKFEYQIQAPDRSPMGILKLPTYPALPRNSRLSGAIPSGLADCVGIHLGDQAYRVDYELLEERAFRGSDLRFFLMDGEKTLATANVYVLNKIRWEIAVNSRRYQLVRKSRFFRMHFDLEQNGQTLGSIRDVSGFTLWRRSFEIDLPPDLADAVQVFLFFLSVNATFR